MNANENAANTNLYVDSFQVGPLGCNCSIIGDYASKEAIVIDPGGDLELIAQKLKDNELKVKAIVHTHTHIDHVGVTSELQHATGAKAQIHEADFFLYSILPIQAQLLGMRKAPVSCEFDTWLHDEDVFAIGDLSLQVIHTPGHTPGSCCFSLTQKNQSTSILFAGDTLFQRSVGRTDLWGGDHDQLIKSIRNRLFSLPEHTEVICGHGENTVIAQEKKYNPFVR
jgi:hydroxyacylglutathione hydrolase